MRFILIDPFLKDRQGHCYFYDSATIAGLQKRGIPFRLLINSGAETGLDLPQCSLSLSDITRNVFAAKGLFKGLAAAASSAISFLRDMDRCLFRDPGFLEDGDILFAQNFYVLEHFFFALLMLFRRARLRRKGVRIKLMLRFRYIRNSRLLTGVQALLYRVSCSLFLAPLGSLVEYVTDSELLKKEYEALLHRKLTVCPVPLYPFVRETAGPADPGRTIISFVGGARHNKGFDVFVEMAARLIRDPGFSARAGFIVQVDVHPQPGREERLVRSAIEKLSGLTHETDTISIRRGTLPTQEYYRLLSGSHIVVLPYTGEAYRSSTANILIETILLGRVPVVSGNTWMSSELSKHGLSDLCFPAGDVSGLVETVKRAIDGYSAFAHTVGLLQKEWKQYHTSDNLVAVLLGGK